ncbi:transglycosylase SLT domain-containing protein [Brevundimonas variabilis]|uniref:Type IV secretion system protein VirB1 n=1 Tax=Brevundimonas variabilis TaxID=74312 RepID=A0A7W9CJZ1_9CAUL|nr:type IV secretion system protein VirB1 [Brevundimonas variabilis]
MLDLTLVLALSAQCAPGVSPQTLAAIAHTESRFNPLAIGVNRGAAVRQPRTRAEAVNTARRLISAGVNIDLGLVQINSANLEWLRLSVEDAFDPCQNLAAAGMVLRAGFDPQSASSDPQHALRVALSRYNTGHPERGFRNGYVARVEASAVQLGFAERPITAPAPGTLPTVSLPDASASPARIPPADWDVFARARVSAVILFVPTPHTQTWSVLP